MSALRAIKGDLEHLLAPDPDEIQARMAKAKASIHARIQVKREALTYRPDTVSYFRDLVEAAVSNPGGRPARERLLRNNREYEITFQAAGVTQTAGAGGEFLPPVWYVEEPGWAARAGRPFLNALGTEPLPPATNQIDVPRLTTGASAAVQTDASAVSNTDLVTTSVTAQVQTVTGRTVASYQAVDLSPGFDAVIFQDLLFAYNSALGQAALTGAVTNAKGLLNVASVNTVTYTDASPTLGELWPLALQAPSAIARQAGATADLAVTSPSSWYSFASTVDASHPALAVPGLGNDLSAAADAQTGNGVVGNIAGTPVVIDANMPTNLGAGTNESRLVFLNRAGFDVYESVPRFKVADQSANLANLQSQLICWGYYACVSRQPKMLTVISGTGMAPLAGY
jgi:HK97 family phage major capsid protein